MDGKVPDDKISEETTTEASEEMESEVLSESAEMTDNTDSANEASAPDEKKPETSQTQSDDTSGIEIVSTSTTSASEMPREGAIASVMESSPVQTEPADTKMVTSDSEIPCEGMANLDSEENTKPPTQTEPVNELTRSIISAADIQNDGDRPSTVEEKPKKLPIESEMVSESIALGSEVPCEPEVSNEVKEKDGEAAGNETSPKPKKGLVEKMKKLLSPTKSKKSKERSKSMSPPEKNKSAASGDSKTAPEEPRISSGGEEHVKQESEKTGLFTMSTIRKTFNKLSLKIKPSGAENKSLVTNEAIERAEEAEVSNSKAEVQTKDGPEQSPVKKPRWTENRTSLVEAQSLGGTTMTDVPSSSSSSVFSEVPSRKQSAAGENTSEEAVACSLVSSTDERIPDVKDKDAGNDSVKKNEPSSEQDNAESENADEEQSTSNENPESKD